MSQLSEFYNLRGDDFEGRVLGEIWGWPNDLLEEEHDYIQWLFPLKEASQFNPNAPLLTDEDIEEIDKDNVRRSFEVMCNFYGVYYTGASVLKCPHTWTSRSHEWLTSCNHNFLRITRILKSLSLFGMDSERITFLMFLEDLYECNREVIGADTISYWREAAQ